MGICSGIVSGKDGDRCSREGKMQQSTRGPLGIMGREASLRCQLPRGPEDKDPAMEDLGLLQGEEAASPCDRH